MYRARRWYGSLVLVMALCPSAAVGQHASSSWKGEAPQNRPESLGTVQARDPGAGHTHKLAGFGAGVTVSAIFLSLDDVLGSSCFGSGNYLTHCRVGYVAAAAAAGGLGALVGKLVKTEAPPGRTTRILLGSALGTLGAFSLSALACEQEEVSNPASLCGYDGMVATRAVVGGAVAGGVLGALVGGRSERLQVRHLGPVPRDGGGMGLGAGFVWRPHRADSNRGAHP